MSFLTYEEAQSYDANGSVIALWRRAGATAVVSYAYDALNRETLHTYDDTFDVVSEYDLASRLTCHLKKKRSTGTLHTRYTNVYDTLGRLTEMQHNEAWQLRNEYDANSNRTKLTPSQAYFARSAGQCKQTGSLFPMPSTSLTGCPLSGVLCTPCRVSVRTNSKLCVGHRCCLHDQCDAASGV